MKNLTFVRISTMALLLIGGCGGAEPVETQSQEPEAAPAQASLDAVAASPMHYGVLLDNSFVRVLRVTLPPGERDEMHTHPTSAWYSIAEGSMRIHEADGSTTDVPITTGQAGLSLAGSAHARENVGTTPLEFILVERKDRPTLETSGAEALEASPEIYSLLAENADFRIVDLAMAAGTGDAPHGHRSSLFYIVSGARMVLRPTGGDRFELDFMPDTVSFQEVENEHTLENVGETDLHLITFELAR